MKWFWLCLVSITLTSCSYITDFYIFNETDTTVEIIYSVKRTEANAPFVTAPKIHPFKKTSKLNDALPINVANLLQDSLTVKAVLLPKQALWIGVDRNFSLQYDTPKLAENLTQLTITQNEKSKSLTAKEAAAMFEQISPKIVGIIID